MQQSKYAVCINLLSTEKHTVYIYLSTRTIAPRWRYGGTARGAAVAMVQRQRYDWLLKAWTKKKKIVSGRP